MFRVLGLGFWVKGSGFAVSYRASSDDWVNDSSNACLHAKCCRGPTVAGCTIHSPTPRLLRRPSHPTYSFQGLDLNSVRFMFSSSLSRDLEAWEEGFGWQAPGGMSARLLRGLGRLGRHRAFF